MKRLVLALGWLALANPLCAIAQTSARQHDFDVSSGKIDKAARNRLSVSSKEMRATLQRASPSQKATLNFTYLGPTKEVSHLGNGEVRHQFGIKLRAQDTCNLVYVMWNFDMQKIAVSVKLNPGQRTHAECLDHGYTGIKPAVSAAAPALHVDQPHTLSADLQGLELTVKADDVLVWQGTLPPVVLNVKGTVGLRSDNARLVFDFLAGEN
jgi:hypothetical protein